MAFTEVFSSVNIALIAGLIGGLLLILAAAQAYKSKNTRNMAIWIGVIGVGVMLAGGFISQADFLIKPITELGGGGAVEIPAAAVAPTTSGSPTIGGKCVGIEDTTVTLSSIDKYTSAAAGTTHRYRINGNPAVTISNAGTFTASPGDKLEILWGNETDTTYFGALTTEVVPCAGTVTFTAELVQNSTFTMDIFDDDGAGKLDGNARNVTLGAGDTVSLDIDIYASNKKGFPYGGILTVEVNKSDFDEEEIYIDIPDLGGMLKKVNTPEIHTLSNVDNVALSFELPALEGATKRSGTLFLDVDDNNNPGDTNDPTVTFRPYDYYINEDTGGSFEGPAVEDEDNAATFGHKTVTTIHVD